MLTAYLGKVHCTSSTPSSQSCNLRNNKSKYVGHKNNLYVTLQMEQSIFASILIKHWWIHISRTFRLDTKRWDTLLRKTDLIAAGNTRINVHIQHLYNHNFQRRLSTLYSASNYCFYNLVKEEIHTIIRRNMALLKILDKLHCEFVHEISNYQICQLRQRYTLNLMFFLIHFPVKIINHKHPSVN